MAVAYKRILRSALIIISCLIVVILAGVALLAAIADGDAGYCIAEGVCVGPQHFLNLSVILALLAVFVLALIDSGGAARGAAVVLLGLYALGGPQFFTRVTEPLEAGSSQNGNDQDSVDLLYAAAAAAIRLDLGDDLEFDGSIPLTEERVFGVYFDLANSVVLQIEVNASTGDLSDPFSSGDPVVYLLRERASQDYVVIEADDDGGRGSNARLVVSLEAGRYFIVARDLAPVTTADPVASFSLKLREKSLDSIPDDQRISLSISEDEGNNVFKGFGVVESVNSTTDYLIAVRQTDSETCLFVDANPVQGAEVGSRYRDPYIQLRDELGHLLAQNDDHSSNDLGASVVWLIPSSAAGQIERYFLQVGAYADNTGFDLFLEVRRKANSNCESVGQYRR